MKKLHFQCSETGQVISAFLVLCVPLMMLFFLAFYVCHMGAHHIRVQKVVDEATKSSCRIQIKGLRFLAHSNRLILTLHATLRSLQVLSVTNALSKTAVLLIEEKIKKAIVRLAQIQDDSIPFFLASSELSAWKLKNQFEIDHLFIQPLKPKYYIERKNYGMLPGPYELSPDFHRMQNVEMKMIDQYHNKLQQSLLTFQPKRIEKNAKIQITGKDLLHSTFEMKFLL